jgi:hypothetical protein
MGLHTRLQALALSNVIEEIRVGRMRALAGAGPRWSRAQMSALLDSVLSDYPIGSVLVWDTETLPRSAATFGVIDQPPLAVGQRTAFVLDGYQRLATLVGALWAPAEGECPWRVWFDVERQGFVHECARASRTMIPLWTLRRTPLWREWTAGVLRPASREEQDRVLDQASRLSRVLEGYVVEVVRVRGTLDEVLEMHARLHPGDREATARVAAALGA